MGEVTATLGAEEMARDPADQQVVDWLERRSRRCFDGPEYRAAKYVRKLEATVYTKNRLVELQRQRIADLEAALSAASDQQARVEEKDREIVRLLEDLQRVRGTNSRLDGALSASEALVSSLEERVKKLEGDKVRLAEVQAEAEKARREAYAPDGGLYRDWYWAMHAKCLELVKENARLKAGPPDPAEHERLQHPEREGTGAPSGMGANHE